MLLENQEYLAQIRDMVEKSGIPWEELDGSSVLVTGAAGMLGSCMVDVLIYLNEFQGYHTRIGALGRTEGKIAARFGEYAKKDYFSILTIDISKEMHLQEDVDYIIHAASNADPFMMANYPVDTLLANVVGMNNVLDLAKRKNTRRVLYVSSGEMYGQPDDTVTDGFYEGYCGSVDYSSPRSCYPSGKRAAEVLCQSYLSQYGVESVIVRPCHCYGPTMTLSDSRALSQFFRKVIDGEDIVLKSDGTLERSHCYVTDAALAMFYVLLKGKAGEAYNIADKDSRATIREAASLIAGTKGKQVLFDLPDDVEKRGFSKVVKAVLNGAKLESLGFAPMVHLSQGVEATVRILESVGE